MSRPDQSITLLRAHGFSVFRFPRASAQPLELMHREGKDLTRLGMVPDLVTPGEVASPRVHRGKSPGIDIEGKETSKVNVAIGLSILYESGEFLTTQQLSPGDAAARALPSAAGPTTTGRAVPYFSNHAARSCASLSNVRVP